MIVNINTPLTLEVASSLKAGDNVLITGTIYTARDAAHKRMIAQLNEGLSLPFDIAGQILYYSGPTPASPGAVIGSCGPTTSCRMDAYTPLLIERGLVGMIGKGCRSEKVVEAIIKHKAVYFGAIGGAGALISKCVKKVEEIAYLDLGTESIKRLTIENLPAIVIIDIYGNNLYNRGNKEL